MNATTIETMTAAIDRIACEDITNENNFAEIVFTINGVAKSGEADSRWVMSAQNFLVALNVIRTSEQVFFEKFTTRTFSVKMNLITMMRQISEAQSTTSNHEKILAYKVAKSSLDVATYHLVVLQQNHDISCVPTDAWSGYIALNAEMQFLRDQIDGNIAALEELFDEECLADLPDEIGSKTEVDELPDEITY